MPIALVATVGSAAANSFVTEAEAIAFAALRLNLTGWVTVSGSACTENEKKGLIEATRLLSALTWLGSRADEVQALAWPRESATNPDSTSSYSSFATSVIPQRVKDATCELAIEFLKAGTTDIATLESTSGVINKTVGPLSTTWADPSQRATGLARFPRVLRLISPLFAIGAGQVRLVR